MATMACALVWSIPALANGPQSSPAQFDAERDVLVSNFDSKPDVDDLHSIAALGSVLTHPDFVCVNYRAVAGAYGDQGGEYIESPELFRLAFGENWWDAHGDRAVTIERFARLILDTLRAGGDVWIQDAGQSNISGAAIRLAHDVAPELDYAGSVHLVQHSNWNESVTDPELLAFVRLAVDYRKIADGNAGNNGTPQFNTKSGADWGRVLANPRIGPMWQEAKRLADEHNPGAAYVNPAISDGGFDFSDTVEAAHILGFGDMSDHTDFFDRFLPEVTGEGICPDP